MKNHKKGLYIGCRDDIRPIIFFNDINEWIFIDALPNFDAGYDENHNEKKYLEMVESSFLKINLIKTKHSINKKMIIFQRKNKEVIYFYNTLFPDCTNFQLKLLKNVNYIFLSAFDPHRKILNMISSKNLTIVIFHYGLFKNDGILPENDTGLQMFLLMNYIENIKYIWVYESGDRRCTDSNQINEEKVRKNLNKIYVKNLLEYSYLEQKYDKNSYKTQLDIPKRILR